MNVKLLPLAMVLLALSHVASAERADRDQPVHIESDKLIVDDKNKVQTFEGNVKLTQGTLLILADKIVVTQDASGFQKGVATGGDGGLARFHQKREGRDEYTDGEAERIEYDARIDQAKLFQRAHVKIGVNEVRGQYIQYDGATELYFVDKGPNNNGDNKGCQRVCSDILPNRPASTTPAVPAKP